MKTQPATRDRAKSLPPYKDPAICTFLLMAYKLNRVTTLRMADELAQRRKSAATQPQYA